MPCSFSPKKPNTNNKNGKGKTPNKPTYELMLNQAENNSPVRLTVLQTVRPCICDISFSEGTDVIAEVERW